MKRIFLSAFVLLIIQSISFAQGLLFDPLTANVFEPRAGALYQFDDDRLRLDIGTSLDLWQSDINNDDRFSVGGDFFTYTRLRSEGRMKFPVETADYFFGANGAWLHKTKDIIYSSRLRISHISSHLVDGYTTNSEFIKEPFVYSREFFDVTVAAEISNIRLYLGTLWIFSTQPDYVNKFIPSIGVDSDFEINDSFAWSSGIDLKYSGTDKESATMLAFQTGIKFRAMDNVAISLNYYYYDGLSIHGMFFEERDNYNAIGFQLHYY